MRFKHFFPLDLAFMQQNKEHPKKKKEKKKKLPMNLHEIVRTFVRTLKKKRLGSQF